MPPRLAGFAAAAARIDQQVAYNHVCREGRRKRLTWMAMRTDRRARPAPDAERAPDAGPGRGGLLRRTFSEFREDNLTDLAAALTYYGVLSMFPALIALVSIAGLVGEPATK